MKRLEAIPFPEEFMIDLTRCLRQVPVQSAFIFGSSVLEGLNAPDLDLAVVADAFEAIPWHRRRELLTLPKGPRCYDLYLFTPREFMRLEGEVPELYERIRIAEWELV